MGKPEPSLLRETLVGLPRAKATILRRLRTGTAATNALLQKMKKRLNPTCPNCNGTETADHMLLICPPYVAQTAQIYQSVQPGAQASPHDVLFPDRTRKTCRKTFQGPAVLPPGQASWNACNHHRYIVTRQRNTLRNSPFQGASPAHASELTARLT